MEADEIVGALLDALKALGLEDDTIVVFASDNGPQGEVVRELGGDMPDMGSPGPGRRELGDVSDGSIRTAAMIRWPNEIRPRVSNAMFSIMDFFPTLAHLAGGKVPDDRPIDGVDQTDLLLGKNDTGRRDETTNLRWPRSGSRSLEAIPRSILPMWRPGAAAGAALVFSAGQAQVQRP